MFAKIVVGYDGGDTGAEALALASRVANAFDSELIVGYGYDDLVASVSTEAADELAAQVKDVLGRAASQLDDTLRVTTRGLPGESPARSLLELAEAEHADLIVVGSRRLGPLRRISTGSVSDPILHGAPCAVAVPPRGYKSPRHGLRRIVAGWVPTEEGDAALRLAHALAARSGGELTVVTTVTVKSELTTLGPIPMLDAGLVLEMRDGAKRDAEAALAKLGDSVRATVDAQEGNAADQLVEPSKKADVVVLGSRGYGPVRRVLLGGVSSAVVRDAHCPVLVLPRSSVEISAGAQRDRATKRRPRRRRPAPS